MKSNNSNKIKIAIAGVGNCASALIQGLEFYKNLNEEEKIPGIMNVSIGNYRIDDIEVVAAFDVDENKVGIDLSQAIFTKPNNTFKFSNVPFLNVKVQKGNTLDGIGKYLKNVITESQKEVSDVAEVLKETKADVLISYLPVGSEIASKWYAEEALKARVAFVNCIPVFIASNEVWQRKFEKAGIPIIGDDVKSQLGATILHRMLASLFKDRGIYLDETFQLNFGGNTDFMNMLERERLESKKISKTNSVLSQTYEGQLKNENIHVGPSDYVPWLKDRKWCYIHMNGRAFGNVPLKCELKLEVWDSPNSAGVVIDAIRCAKLALDRGIGGALIGPASYFMKTPPKQFNDYEARLLTEEFIKGEFSEVKIKNKK